MSRRTSTGRKSKSPRTRRRLPASAVSEAEAVGFSSWLGALDAGVWNLRIDESTDDDVAAFALPRIRLLARRLLLCALEPIEMESVIAGLDRDDGGERTISAAIFAALRRRMAIPEGLGRVGAAVASLKGFSDLLWQMTRLAVPAMRSEMSDERTVIDNWGFLDDVRQELVARRHAPRLRVLIDELLAGVLLELPETPHEVSRLETRLIRQLLRVERELSPAAVADPPPLRAVIDAQGNLTIDGNPVFRVRDRDRAEIMALRELGTRGAADLSAPVQKRVSALVATGTNRRLLVKACMSGSRRMSHERVACTVRDRVTGHKARVNWEE